MSIDDLRTSLRSWPPIPDRSTCTIVCSRQRIGRGESHNRRRRDPRRTGRRCRFYHAAPNAGRHRTGNGPAESDDIQQPGTEPGGAARLRVAPGANLGPVANATATLPSWGTSASGCATGKVRFANGQYSSNRGRPVINVLASVQADVDGDGVMESIVQLSCGEGPEAGGQQIVAFRPASGDFQPIGRIVGTQDGIAMMDTMQVRAGGQIAVQVSAQYSDSGHNSFPANGGYTRGNPDDSDRSAVQPRSRPTRRRRNSPSPCRILSSRPPMASTTREA